MRITVWGMVALAALLFAVAGVIANRGGSSVATAPRVVIATGVVTALADGPHHAVVRVAPAGDPAFTFPANTQAGLTVGQQVVVRYRPNAPVATARVADGAKHGEDDAHGDVRGLVLVGIALLIAAVLSPLLVRWFPGLLAFRFRP